MISIPLVSRNNAQSPESWPSGAIHTYIDGDAGLAYFYMDGDTIPPEHNPLSTIAQSTPPKWAQFRMAMLSDPGFLRIVSFGLPIHQASLASEINQNPPNQPTVSAIRTIWNGIVQSIPDGQEPTTTEIAQWQAIATAARIPLVFNPTTAML